MHNSHNWLRTSLFNLVKVWPFHFWSIGCSVSLIAGWGGGWVSGRLTRTLLRRYHQSHRLYPHWSASFSGQSPSPTSYTEEDQKNRGSSWLPIDLSSGLLLRGGFQPTRSILLLSFLFSTTIHHTQSIRVLPNTSLSTMQFYAWIPDLIKSPNLHVFPS